MDFYPHVCWFVQATSKEIINCSWTPCRYSRRGKVAEGQTGTRKGTLRGRPSRVCLKEGTPDSEGFSS